MLFATIKLLWSFLKVLNQSLVTFFHSFELASTFDSWIFVLSFALPRNTLSFHYVIIDVTLDALSHLFNFAWNHLLHFSWLFFTTFFFISQAFFLFFVNVITFNLAWFYLGEVYLSLGLNLFLLWYFSKFNFFSSLFNLLIRCTCDVFNGAFRSQLVHHCLDIILQVFLFLSLFLFSHRLVIKFAALWFFLLTHFVVLTLIDFWIFRHFNFTIFLWILGILLIWVFSFAYNDVFFQFWLFLCFLFLRCLNLFYSIVKFCVKWFELVKQILYISQFKQNGMLLYIFVFKFHKQVKAEISRVRHH